MGFAPRLGVVSVIALIWLGHAAIARAGLRADFLFHPEVYVAVVTPALDVFWMTPSGFSATPTRLYSGPLAAFAAVPLITIPDAASLMEGDYYWVTIVDADANGVPNGTFVDYVKTTRVSAGAPLASRAIR